MSSQGFTFGGVILNSGLNEEFEIGFAGDQEIHTDTAEFFCSLDSGHVDGIFFALGSTNEIELHSWDSHRS